MLISRARRGEAGLTDPPRANPVPDALIWHRLDYDTSACSCWRAAGHHRALSMVFQDARQVEKRYVAVVDGRMESESGEVNLPLIVDWPNRPRHIVVSTSASRRPLYRVLNYDTEAHTTRVALTPETGRTHQLRVHRAIAWPPDPWRHTLCHRTGAGKGRSPVVARRVPLLRPPGNRRNPEFRLPAEF